MFFLSEEGNKFFVEKQKKIFMMFIWTNWFHQRKIRKTLGNLYISPKRKTFYNNISLDSCFKHFRALLEKEADLDFDDENAVQDKESFLNLPISKEEVMFAFRKLKHKKSSWTRRNNRKMMKNSRTHVTDFFVKNLMLCLRKEFFQLNLSYSLCWRC